MILIVLETNYSSREHSLQTGGSKEYSVLTQREDAGEGYGGQEEAG
jgi:hypothetical protein